MKNITKHPSPLAPLLPSPSTPQPPSTHASVLPDTPAPQPPSTLAPLLRLWEGWKSFARLMGGFQSRVLLSLFYFFVVTPFGLGVRVFGDPLFLRQTRKLSNWIPRDETSPTSIEEAKKQF